MSEQEHKNQYDVVSLSRVGQEKRTNFVQNAAHMSKAHKETGRFTDVLANTWLKHELGKKYVV
jgi:hypothetical protein